MRLVEEAFTTRGRLLSVSADDGFAADAVVDRRLARSTAASSMTTI
jgi:hypothetical protein